MTATGTLETRALVLFAAFTGCRKSEAFGLRWEDADLTERDERVLVRRQHYKGRTVERTKTRAGARELVLGPHAAAVLREVSVAQLVDERPNPHGVIFPSPSGGYWLDTNFDRRVFGPARAAAGVPWMTFHGLRRFFVSRVRGAGLPTSITEQLAGHSDDATHRLYTRPIPGTEGPIRDGLSRAFSAEFAEWCLPRACHAQPPRSARE